MNFWVFKNWMEQITCGQQSNQWRPLFPPPPHVRCNISAHVLFMGGWGEGLACADSVVLTTHLSERNWLHRRYLFKNYKMIIGRTWGDRTPFSAVQIYFLFFVNFVYITILVILNSLGTFKLNIINILICLMTFSVYLHIQKYYKNQSSNWPAADERYDVIADEVIILGQENFSSLTLTRY